MTPRRQRIGFEPAADPPADPDIGIDASLPGRQGIQSVEIAMTVLVALEQGAGPMSLSAVAARSGMAPSKTHRYLVSLRRAGLISQSPATGLYDLGPAMRRLGAEALRRMDEVSFASDHLPGLRDRTRQSVNLSVWGDDGPIVVRWEYGAHVLPITVRVGATLPMLPSSAGRVFLAFLPESLTAPVLAAHADASGMSAAEIEDIKAEVRRTGVSITFDGVIPGVVSIAAPVFGTASSLPLAVALTLPRSQASAAALEHLSAELLAATLEISTELGSGIASGGADVRRRLVEPVPGVPAATAPTR